MIATAIRTRLADPVPTKRKPLPSSLVAAAELYKSAVSSNAFISIFGSNDEATLVARKCVLEMLALQLEHDSGLLPLLEAAAGALAEIREDIPGMIETSPRLAHLEAIVTKLLKPSNHQ